MKKKIRENLDTFIDEFVTRINSTQREPLDAEDIPSYMRIGDRDIFNRYSWKILKMDCLWWVEPLIAKLPKHFPPSSSRKHKLPASTEKASCG